LDKSKVKRKFNIFFGVLVAVCSAELVAAGAEFTLDNFVPYPGVGDYQVDTSVFLAGKPPQLQSQLVCIEIIDAATVLQSIAPANSLGEFLDCKKTVLQDTATTAKVETKCVGNVSVLAMERAKTDTLTITSTNFGTSGEVVIKSVSSARWLRRPCSVKPILTNSTTNAKLPQVPQATAKQCTEMSAQLAKLVAGKDQMPPGSLDQALALLRRSLKAQGCN
jgi:hypothetical protein